VIHDPVICPTIDDATVENTRWLINELRADGFSVEQVAEIAAEHLADAVAMYRTDAQRRAMKATDWYVTNTETPDFDPTDAELAQSWNAPDAPLAHRVAWQLHQETHDRSAS
jgi:hypothetical protein